ncbi:hypothetical protein KIN20_014151 [Parelaphostrongylus tenuis]|uniref:Uncharacterized protein n=1 Tax=Parelaphostrongylus tenuis TaxID=148309 RepID=A0AAD5MD63_PARTN|nr:hypothetical protein KIN20_014151 [Parelaphostrongylus tenuis]
MVVFTSCADPGTYPKWYIADRAYDIPWFLDIMNVNQQISTAQIADLKTNSVKTRILAPYRICSVAP